MLNMCAAYAFSHPHNLMASTRLSSCRLTRILRTISITVLQKTVKFFLPAPLDWHILCGASMPGVWINYCAWFRITSNTLHKMFCKHRSVKRKFPFSLRVQSIITIQLSVWRQVQSLFQNDPSTYCDPQLPPSNESILFCPYGHPVISYVFFPVFLWLLSPILSFLQ